MNNPKVIYIYNSLLKLILIDLVIYSGKFCGRCHYCIIFVDGNCQNTTWLNDIITHEKYHSKQWYKMGFFKYLFRYLFSSNWRFSIEKWAYMLNGPACWKSESSKVNDVEKYVISIYNTHGMDTEYIFDIEGNVIGSKRTKEIS